MKICIINPNSDEKMTAAIQKTARDNAADEFEVVCFSTPGAPPFIETYADQLQAAPGMLHLLQENIKNCQAFVIACHCDPHLDAFKEISPVPVVGIGEASMKLATMLGHRFSVLSATAQSVPNKEALIRKYHLEEQLASVRAPDGKTQLSDPEDLYLDLAKKAMAEDGAEVIVLGCAGFTGLDRNIGKKLGIPVLDPVICGLILASGFARHGLTTSKIKRYRGRIPE
jgi:allantoin racemase